MPAYGKTYKTKEEVREAWDNNVTFKTYNGPYLDKKNWKKYGSPLDSLTFCYGNLTVYIQTGILS